MVPGASSSPRADDIGSARPAEWPWPLPTRSALPPKSPTEAGVLRSTDVHMDFD